MYDFLEKLGCRKYSPNAELIPKKKLLRIPQYNITEIPVFHYRETLMPDASDPDYAEWHKLHHRSEREKDWGMWVHTFDNLISPEKYFNEHPEYFSLNNGVRSSKTQLCLSNPNVLDLVILRLKDLISQNHQASHWSVSQNDTYGPCECSGCKNIDNQYGGVPSGSLIHFVNQVAEQFPNKIISTLAYQYSRKAPEGIIPAENVNIVLCTIELNRSKPIRNDPNSQGFVNDISNWKKLTNNILIWDYIVQFRNYLNPFPNLHVLQPNIKFFLDSGVQMMFEQGSNRSLSEFHELRSYIMAKLLWNPDADVDAIMNDFLNGFYGDAGPHLRKYIDQMRKALVESDGPLTIYGYPWDGYQTYLTPALLHEYTSYFNDAEAAVSEQPDILARVEKARLPLEFAILEISKRNVTEAYSLFNKSGKRWEIKLEMQEKMEQFVQDANRFQFKRLHEMGFTPNEYHKSMNDYFENGITDHLAYGTTVSLKYPYSDKYPVGGETALTDGLRGTNDYHFNWLGFEGYEMNAVVDLGKIRKINNISVNFLQDAKSWVWIPHTVTFSGSTDDVNYQQIKFARKKTDEYDYENIIESFSAKVKQIPFQFIRITTESFIQCPDWHLGAGGKAWIFADEIVIR
ncbi:MAG: DUF4838 domain-containing protein [Candidatus Neomarinimicrobiota bacterium]|nr:DUF4838 domain-containing protein [Candidatus Neomarinimicrobiota bacterium]